MPMEVQEMIGAFARRIAAACGITRDPDAQSSPNKDAAVLAALKRAGSDLSKPHPIEFFLYLPAEGAASTVAAHLTAQGFDAKVDRGADNAAWLCLATKSIVPDLATLEAIRLEFDGLAGPLGGEYDGWGTPVVK
jgi:Regulator of ribonuclease activity B